jgi:hypothetical protein
MPKDIVEQLKLAELWFDVDSGETVPVEREHGKWLFKTAADEIERLRANLDKYHQWHASLLDCRIWLV